jgi:hypothetical protein
MKQSIILVASVELIKILLLWVIFKSGRYVAIVGKVYLFWFLSKVISWVT